MHETDRNNIYSCNCARGVWILYIWEILTLLEKVKDNRTLWKQPFVVLPQGIASVRSWTGEDVSCISCIWGARSASPVSWSIPVRVSSKEKGIEQSCLALIEELW